MNDGTDYRAILASDTPLIDVRAPIEFAQGAMPAAVNLPLMNDDERAAVGTCYKRQGPDAALALGHRLVSGDTRDARINAWREASLAHPEGFLCCARGGQRSHISQAWLKEAGIDYPLIRGGYKALRQTAIQVTIEQSQKPMVLIGGCTGNGKTLLVKQHAQGIDLEGLAHHRGSSFGRTLTPQLSQASFENHLAAELLKKDAARWVLEDAADIGIATESLSQYDDLVTLPCYEWQHALVLPPGHPLLERERIGLEDLAAYPLITYHPTFTGRTRIDHAFAQRGLSPQIVLEAIDSDVIKTYVKLGMGVGIVAEMAVQGDERTPELIARPAGYLFGHNVARVAFKRGAYLRQFVLRFAEFLSDRLSRDLILRAMEGGGHDDQL